MPLKLTNMRRYLLKEKVEEGKSGGQERWVPGGEKQVLGKGVALLGS